MALMRKRAGMNPTWALLPSHLVGTRRGGRVWCRFPLGQASCDWVRNGNLNSLLKHVSRKHRDDFPDIVLPAEKIFHEWKSKHAESKDQKRARREGNEVSPATFDSFRSSTIPGSTLPPDTPLDFQEWASEPENKSERGDKTDSLNESYQSTTPYEEPISRILDLGQEIFNETRGSPNLSHEPVETTIEALDMDRGPSVPSPDMDSCPLCSAALSKVEDLASHLRGDLRYFPWQCNLCPAKFTGQESAEFHFTSPLTRHPGASADFVEKVEKKKELEIFAIMQRIRSNEPPKNSSFSSGHSLSQPTCNSEGGSNVTAYEKAGFGALPTLPNLVKEESQCDILNRPMPESLTLKTAKMTPVKVPHNSNLKQMPDPLAHPHTSPRKRETLGMRAKCLVCQKLVSGLTRESIKQHSLKHRKQPKCVTCGYSNDLHNVKEHIESAHGEGEIFNEKLSTKEIWSLYIECFGEEKIGEIYPIWRKNEAERQKRTLEKKKGRY